MRRNFPILLTLLVLLLLGAASVGAAPCELPGLDRPARCEIIPVAEDPTAAEDPAARRIPLHVVILPAREADPAPDPVFYLVGGPGFGATGAVRLFADGFSALQARRDIVLVDARGTGRSNPLNCPWESPQQALAAVLEGKVEADFLRRCRLDLEADPTFYTTSQIVEDLEHVRRTLGYGPINLVAASYGTRVALEYLRRYPDSVRTATLRAVSPPAKRLHIPGPGAQAALDRVFAGAPEGQRSLEAVLARLARQPVTLQVPDPRSGVEMEVTLSRDAFAMGLFHLLYDARGAGRLPTLVEAADRGDFTPFLKVVGGILGGFSDWSLGAYLSVVCAEDVPFPVQPAPFPGGEGAERLAAACRAWPHTPVAAAFKEPVRSTVPVLLLSGDRDPTTPAEMAAEVARPLTHGHPVVVENLSHLPTWTDCLVDLVARFVEGGGAWNATPSC